jgi:hypothetical protein
VLGLVGDFDLPAVLARLGELDLRDRSQGTCRKGQAARAPPTLTGPREREIFKEREQAHIAVGFPAWCSATRASR